MGGSDATVGGGQIKGIEGRADVALVDRNTIRGAFVRSDRAGI